MGFGLKQESLFLDTWIGPKAVDMLYGEHGKDNMPFWKNKSSDSKSGFQIQKWL